MKILVTGATGLVGRRLVTHLEAAGHEVLSLSRHAEEGPGSKHIGVDLVKAPFQDDRLKDVTAVVNLMGESIFGLRWTPEKKQRILESRVQGTKNLIQSLQSSGAQPKVFVSTSAVGYYGDGKDEVLTEGHQAGTDFLASVCRQWEEAARGAERAFPDVRFVICRFGVVLSHKGGMLDKMRTPFSLGAGTTIGNGKQWMSWIHELDLTQILMTVLQDDRIKGVVNAVAPQPVTNAEFTKVFAKSLGSSARLSVPGFAIRLAMGEMADMLLFSQRAEPQLLAHKSFQFRYRDITSALNSFVVPG